MILACLYPVAAMKNISLASPVVRLASDYTSGRQGHVVELSEDGKRFRVQWHQQGEKMNRKPMNLKTWIKGADLAINPKCSCGADCCR